MDFNWTDTVKVFLNDFKNVRSIKKILVDIVFVCVSY